MKASQNPFHFALTGFPLGHSLSPVIHNTALRACKLIGSYTLRPVSLEQASSGLNDLIRELRDGSLDGLNVTIPYKQAIFRLCDQLTPAARSIGAANLIYRSDSDGSIWGDNSDAPGFLAALRPLENRWPSTLRRAVVLGAGGSARAVIYALASAGWQVQVAARRLDQAVDLVGELGLSLPGAALSTTGLTLQDYEGMRAADLIVNTTPLGMFPHSDGCPWPETVPLSSQPVYYDLVYNPRQTRLLKLASSAGAVTIGGITMLVEQAAIAFQRWTGLPAPTQAMMDSVK
jgi:shikimate dehydrogenase